MISHSSMGMLGILGLTLMKGALAISKAPTKQELLLMRLDNAERIYLAKISSPTYHAAQAKRERKRRKLLKSKKAS